MKIFLTSNLLEEAVVILDKERTVEADLMMVATVIGIRSTTGEEMVVMTPVVEAEAQGTTEVEAKAKEAEENLIAKVEVEAETPEAETVVVIQEAVEAQGNLSLTEVVALQKDQVEAVDAAETISVNRVTIILADELICAAS